ncbi:hypothetical protein EG329_014122 [Mollisiaceae sp. DMI_Dod_QoI]|nr:hypothetical protein EG329_014122 [Helotiales sp. DMI_Dod_QoI]
MTLPDPVVLNPSQVWDGNDGPWSTFFMQIGNPPRAIRVLISTISGNIFAILPDGCATVGYPTNCPSLRGFDVTVNESSTWIANKPNSTRDPYFSLSIEDRLGISGYGEFGFDSATMSAIGAGGPTVNHTSIAGIATSEFWLGLVGVSPQSQNFTSLEDPQPSYLSLLKQHNKIPSLSFGYTAGNQYSLSGIYGSFVFGGYDASRFTANGYSFDFGESENGQDLYVGLQSITAYSTNVSFGGTKTLLPNPIYALIDSTVPELWLPMEACEAFETAFGLVHNNETDRYLVNGSLQANLRAQNPTFTFELGNIDTGPPSVTLNLSYAAFDLIVGYPIVTSNYPYFPLRRAANASQYTIGRMFLQETYLTVDYERRNFSLNQALFSRNTSQQLVTIKPLGEAQNKGLSSGGIAGIVVAIVAFIVMGSVGYLIYKKQRKRKEQRAKEARDAKEVVQAEAEVERIRIETLGQELEAKNLPELGHNQQIPAETDGTALPGHELEDVNVRGELEGVQSELWEMDGNDARRHELPGDDLDLPEMGISRSR